jgi:hypothetical protein
MLHNFVCNKALGFRPGGDCTPSIHGAKSRKKILLPIASLEVQ